MKQTAFTFFNDFTKDFGGSLLEGKRKGVRPLSTKNPVHLVLKSSGHRFFNPTNWELENIIRTQARKYKIRIHKLSFNWTHIHGLMSLPSREAYNAFIRTVTSIIVEYLTQKWQKNLKNLFTLRPYTRILSWGREYKNVYDYHELNDQEALGLIRREKKKKRLRKKRPSPAPPSEEDRRHF